MTRHSDYTILTVQIEHIVLKDLYNILKNHSETRGITMKTNTNKVLLPLLAAALLFSVACDYAGTTAPEAMDETVTSNAVPADEINWVSWNSDVLDRVTASNDALFKKHKKKKKKDDDEKDETVGFDEKWIEADEGGKVGNNDLTLGNKVNIPEDALRDDALVRVDLNTSADNPNHNGFGEVEFTVDGGHYQFNRNVKITLTYKYLDLPEDFDPTTLKIWWYDDSGLGWVELEDLDFNTDKEFVKFRIDHFTRYGWAF